MSNIDITPIDEGIAEKPKAKKSSKNNDVDIERLRHDNFISELNSIKELILMQNKTTERGNENLNKKSNPETTFIKPLSQTPQIIRQPEMKKKFKWKFILFPLLFLFSSLTAFIIINSFFEADTITKITFTLGAGFFVVIINWLIYIILRKILIGKQSYSYQAINGNANHQLADINICPLCSEKVSKSKVFEQNNEYVQIVKCLNPVCEFRKELKFGV